MKRTMLAILAAGLLTSPIAALAEVITGTISGWIESSPAIEIGDDNNTVQFWWSFDGGGSAFFYGSNYAAYPSDVAVAIGVTDVTQITDASVFTYTGDGTSEQTPGTFMVARNTESGCYGVLRIDSITSTVFPADTLDGTWWFQTDCTGDFNPSDPAALLGQLHNAIPAGVVGRKLKSQVALAQTYYAADDIQATCAVLDDVVKSLQSKGVRKKISAVTADDLIADTQAIQAAIGCS